MIAAFLCLLGTATMVIGSDLGDRLNGTPINFWAWMAVSCCATISSSFFSLAGRLAFGW